MNQTKSSKIITVVVLLIFFMLPMFLLAQNDPPPGGGGSPDSPIDGGLSLLIAAGIGYGAKKVHDNKKKKQAENNKQDL